MLRDIGSGNFGVAKLVRDVRTKELFAIKLIERGHKVASFFGPPLQNPILIGVCFLMFLFNSWFLLSHFDCFFADVGYYFKFMVCCPFNP